MEFVQTTMLKWILWTCAEAAPCLPAELRHRRGSAVNHCKPGYAPPYSLSPSVHRHTEPSALKHWASAGSREGKAGSLSHALPPLPHHAPEGGRHRGLSTAVRLPPVSQVIAEGKGVTEDNKKKRCHMVYGTNLPLLSSPRPTVLLGMEGVGKKMRLWVGDSPRRGWKPLMQWILLSNKA